ncbi:MAG: hypothetical protein MUF87_15855 [Anaerolineae bacterium]|jgi:hypothetical protein|nr:hypothetical protein [Anaerolineae bacterium]
MIIQRALVWGLFAALLAFGSEILLGKALQAGVSLELALKLIGYLAISAFLIDTMIRYRVRDLLGLMTIAGVYGLLSALLINPAATLFDIPRTLVTRVTGAHALLGLEMLFVFLALTGGHLRHLRWILMLGAAIVGIAWGVWGRWEIQLSFELFLAIGGISISVLVLLTALLYRRGYNLTPQILLLTRIEWIVIGGIAFGLLILRLAQGVLSTSALFLVLVLLGICAAILWFRRETKLTPILYYHLPIVPMRWLWIILAIGMLFWTGSLAYQLPLLGEIFNQYLFVVYGFTLYGLAWLPTVSLILGARAYVRQIQARPM